ncbi:purine nucleoside phosphorylase [[Clostridium] ultunense Esp]|uniref:Purine nucleoside phosphorylase n=1 Tax=[Clostridium] ultunense Esp TaxID=1288971 RepID=M1ZH84_9FIRM|nr:purine-nucleoside phosphorylase [Schnuerera ultunensis]CCQ93192.1 purine nucleoside phosphorylase [[Clostridium] ultunense Esp]SHD77139.1 purine nucleoside phosphorylase [[Clostridium] ultunense Esp]
MDYMNKMKESIKFIKSKTKETPSIGLVLGSGLGSLGEKIENPMVIDYKDIPNFPMSTVEGHKGQLILGQLGNKKVIAMQGRFHYYEGYPLKDVVFPIRVMIGLGIENLIVTNAAGGVDEDFCPGDLMIIKDHINFTGQNPLIGQNFDDLGPRFVDMTRAYDERLMSIAKKAGEDLGISLKEGVYMWFTGPTYETPAEIKLARTLGASAVGMSTVPEVIVAAHQGIKVLGISCITNMAAGILDQPLKHEEVIETSLMVKDKFERLVIEILFNI